MTIINNLTATEELLAYEQDFRIIASYLYHRRAQIDSATEDPGLSRYHAAEAALIWKDRMANWMRECLTREV